MGGGLSTESAARRISELKSGRAASIARSFGANESGPASKRVPPKATSPLDAGQRYCDDRDFRFAPDRAGRRRAGREQTSTGTATSSAMSS
jgi:hypothetical protein